MVEVLYTKRTDDELMVLFIITDESDHASINRRIQIMIKRWYDVELDETFYFKPNVVHYMKYDHVKASISFEPIRME